jgi:biotin carboxyl carrier protein
MPAYVIDKGIASAELLSHVLVSKYADHLPLYRQRQIFLRAGIDLSRSTLSDWIARCGVELEPLADALKQVVQQQRVNHADETPVTTMQLGDDEKKPKKGYVWAYATTQYNPVQAVIYDFQPSRSGQHAEEFLKGWQGHLVCDDYSGYKACFRSGQVIEVGCMAQANLDLTRQDYQREQQLWSQGISAKQDYQRAESAYRQAQITVQSSQARLNALGASGNNNGRFLIRAPISGVISQKDIVVGENVQLSDQLFVIEQLKDLWLEFNLPNQFSGQLQAGQKLTLK